MPSDQTLPPVAQLCPFPPLGYFSPLTRLSSNFLLPVLCQFRTLPPSQQYPCPIREARLVCLSGGVVSLGGEPPGQP